MEESSEQSFQTILANYRVELERIRELMDMAFSRGAKSTDAPEDKVVFPLLVSCRDIVEEVLFAINDGFGRAALRATRTMYECVVTARFLNLHPEKAGDFLRLFHVEWAKILQEIPAEYRNLSIEPEIANRVPKYAAGKRVGMADLNWSGSQIHEMAQIAGPIVHLHSSAYVLPSAYIHPGCMFFLRLLSRSGSDGSQLEVGSHSQTYESRTALGNAHDLILNAADLRLKYDKSPKLQEKLDLCKGDFLRLWGYEPHL